MVTEMKITTQEATRCSLNITLDTFCGAMTPDGTKKMTYPEAHHAMLPTNSSEGSPFHTNAQMSSISSKSSMKRLDSRDSSWVKILVLVPGTVVNTKVAGKTWMCITPSSGIIGLKWFEPVSTNICQWVYICINMWIYKYIII